MSKQAFALMLSVILLATVFCIQSVRAQTVQDTRLAAQVRARVQKMGVGHDARVHVRLRDNTRLEGYISAAGEDSFTVADSKTGANQTISYTDVTEVRKPGGVSTKMLLIVGAAAVAAIIIGVTVIKPVVCDGGAGC